VNSLFLLLFLASIILLIVRLKNPSLFKNKTDKPMDRKTVVIRSSILAVIFFILFVITMPESTSHKDTEIKDSQSKGYSIIIESDASTAERNRKEIYILSPEATTFEELAHTAMQAAIDYRKKTKADVVSVFIELSKESARNGMPLAVARYAPDGKGYYSDTWIWQVHAVKEYPSEQIKQVAELWYKNKAKFQRDGMTDEKALEKYIANELKIKESDVLLYSPATEIYEVLL